NPPTASRLPRVSFREMRAVICRAWGPVDDLKLEDVAPPRPGPGQLVIDVKATGVNYADSIMVAGRYQTRPTFPFSPGLETAGVVTRCGEGVTRFKTGDRVMAILAYGGFAEQALADEAETFAIPDAMPFDEAGAFPIAYISSHAAIRWQGQLLAGETLLVLGAAGGVGLTAVEIGKAMGARVIAGASTAEKLAVARERGADAHGPHVVVVTIDNQPRRNAMPRAMLAELAALWDRLARDGTCRCIVLTGAGERAFSSGADMSGDLSADPETARTVNHALLKN